MELTFMSRARAGRAIFGRGVLAAVCILAMLGFASCDDDSMQMGTMRNMDGYFLTWDDMNNVTCQSEDLILTENADGTVDSTSVFAGFSITHRGWKAENVNAGRANKEILALAYAVINADSGEPENPGIYYFQKTSDDPVRFGGFWIGKPNRPQDGTENVICPYIMVPGDETDAGECPDDIDEMLGDACYGTNAAGFLDPMVTFPRSADSQ